MYCSKCGNEMKNDEIFCSHCGNRFRNDTDITKNVQMDSGQMIRCPVCGGNHLQAISENDDHVLTTGGGYSGTKGCCGYLLFGPLGLLCGSCGSKQKTTVIQDRKLYWVCQTCGHKFRNEQDLAEERDGKLAQKRKAGTLFLILGIIELFCSLVLMGMGGNDDFSRLLTFGVIFGIFCLIIGVIMLIAGNAVSEQQEDANAIAGNTVGEQQENADAIAVADVSDESSSEFLSEETYHDENENHNLHISKKICPRCDAPVAQNSNICPYCNFVFKK